MTPDDPARIRAQFLADQDPYLDPFWRILKNTVNARTQTELDAAENDLVYHRQVTLEANPIDGDYDLTHLQAIHHHLFQDVYPFAGELRTVNIRKEDDPSGWFFPADRLQDGAAHVFAELHDDNLLKNLDQDTFTNKLAHHLDSINHLHPFREGNGRTQRQFLNQLSHDAGYTLDWSAITPKQNNHASQHGETALREVLHDVCQCQVNCEPLLPTRHYWPSIHLALTDVVHPSPDPFIEIQARPIEHPDEHLWQQLDNVKHEPTHDQDRHTIIDTPTSDISRDQDPPEMTM